MNCSAMEGLRKSPNIAYSARTDSYSSRTDFKQHGSDIRLVKDAEQSRYFPKFSSPVESRLTIPIPVYPVPRSPRSRSRSCIERGDSVSEERPRPSSYIHRPAAETRSTSPRKTFKSHSISEILKPKETPRTIKDSVDRSPSHAHRELCYSPRYSSDHHYPRESSMVWNYEDSSSNHSSCCHCVSPLQFPYSLPHHRSWSFPMNSEAEALACGYASAGMFDVYVIPDACFTIDFFCVLVNQQTSFIARSATAVVNTHMVGKEVWGNLGKSPK